MAREEGDLAFGKFDFVHIVGGKKGVPKGEKNINQRLL